MMFSPGPTCPHGDDPLLCDKGACDEPDLFDVDPFDNRWT
jgi:hypothetical protein